MNLVIEKSVTVITPTIGKTELVKAIESVQNQTVKCNHLIVCDGSEHWDTVKLLTGNSGCQVVQTPCNTGAAGFNGQRIYAAYPHLVNADYVLFLDEDNFYEPNHVESLIDLIEKRGLDFAYSLRKIHDKNGTYLCNDDCESLGKWEIFLSRHSTSGPAYLIDTSSFCFKHKFIKDTCHLWHSGPWGEDRRYLYFVKDHAKYDTTGLYTLGYRLDGNPNSVTEEFFQKGNKIQLEYYGGRYPWRKI
jgi:glycosyltransferase involved in cell wall biosynthesis